MKHLVSTLLVVAALITAVPGQNTPSGQQPQAEPRPEMRIRVSDRVLDSLAVKKVLPKLPCSNAAGLEKGVVTHLVLVDYDGIVKQTKLLSGDPALGECALAAIKNWQFKPYLVDGKPLQVESRITIKFSKKHAEVELGTR